MFTLLDIDSYIDVCASDLLPHSFPKTCTYIVNADPLTVGGSQWLTVNFRPKFYSPYYFDSYSIVPLLHDILAFKRRKGTNWDHNGRQLHGLTRDVCGKY